MAYEPTNWKTGDVVTSAKLNKLEQGVADGSGVLVVHSTYDGSLDTYVLNKTAFEIYSASLEGKVVVIAHDSKTMLFTTSYLSLINVDPETDASALLFTTSYLGLITVNPETDAVAFRFMDISPDGQIGVTMYTAGTKDDYPRLNS